METKKAAKLFDLIACVTDEWTICPLKKTEFLRSVLTFMLFRYIIKLQGKPCKAVSSKDYEKIIALDLAVGRLFFCDNNNDKEHCNKCAKDVFHILTTSCALDLAFAMILRGSTPHRRIG